MRYWPFLLFVAVVAGAGCSFWYQHRQQIQLTTNLQQVDSLLVAQNDVMRLAAGGELEYIERNLASNRYTPTDAHTLLTARQLTRRANFLLNALQQLSRQLLLATGNASYRHNLRHPNESRATRQLLDVEAPARRQLRQYLADYTAALQQIIPTDSVSWQELDFKSLSAATALATLTQLEYDVRTTELRALRQLSQHIDTRHLKPNVHAFATAEASTVAPGETYRATLFLAAVLSSPAIGLRMACNGRPVAVDAHGIGRVRFVAPTRPGPATWTASVIFKQAGRDTIYTIQVPYRVALR